MSIIWDQQLPRGEVGGSGGRKGEWAELRIFRAVKLLCVYSIDGHTIVYLSKPIEHTAQSES